MLEQVEDLSMAVQAQQSELQSLLRLTESTQEGQGQGQGKGLPSVSFRALVLDRAIPHTLLRYALALFTVAFQPQTHTPDTPGAATESESRLETQPNPGVQVLAEDSQPEASADQQAGQIKKAAEDGHEQEGILCKRGSEQWGKAVSMAGLPWALQLLAAFARGHQVTDSTWHFRPSIP